MADYGICPLSETVDIQVSNSEDTFVVSGAVAEQVSGSFEFITYQKIKTFTTFVILGGMQEAELHRLPPSLRIFSSTCSLSR